ncbi:MAG: GNAT family N-acetyltransferase [Clostridia bacterium]|nr:GNAT family N-acetyltransferase [Clostridia bacterium]
MTLEPVSIRDTLGREVVLRHAQPADAAALIEYLKITAAETPYLIREPDEITLTLEEEIGFIERKEKEPRELLLIALVNGKHVGNCSLMRIAPYRRYAHRCSIAIALYEEYCGCGIGRRMLQTVLDAARQAGYTQAELEVLSDNRRAIALYRKLGFEKFGTLPDNVRYADGTCADADWMMKKL